MINKLQQYIIAGIDAIGKAYTEGLDMFMYNFKNGMNRKNQSYVGRFDQAKDIAELHRQKRLVEKYGTDNQKRAYNVLTTIADFNTNPFVRFSQNAMGAGDAMARTVIGRLEMRMRAAREGIEQGVDIKNLTEYAARTEVDFRNMIFKEKDGKFIISDEEAAQMAGNEATLTTALPDSLRIFEVFKQNSWRSIFLSICTYRLQCYSFKLGPYTFRNIY